MMSINKRKKGNLAETIVLEKYQDNGWKLVQSNFTIRGGEIDLLMENEYTLVCIEVKLVDFVDELSGYMTKKKIGAIKRTFENFLRKYPTKKSIRIDVVFVKEHSIREIYENISGN